MACLIKENKLQLITRQFMKLRVTRSRLCYQQYHVNCENIPKQLKGNNLNKFRITYSNAVFVKWKATLPNKIEEAEEEFENKTEKRLMENKYLHSLLENSMYYKNTIANPSKVYMNITDEVANDILCRNWEETEDLQEIITALKKLSYHSLSSNTNMEISKYDSIFIPLGKRVKEMNIEMAKEVLNSLLNLKSIRNDSVSMRALLQQLDTAMYLKLKELSMDDKFLLCDTFYQLNTSYKYQFIWSAVLRLGSKPSKLKPHNFVQLMFYLNICRKLNLNMFEIECRLEELLNDIPPSELCIVAMGFFKSKTRIRNSDLLIAIMEKVSKYINTLDTMAIGLCFKLFRYSVNGFENAAFQKLVNSIEPRLPEFSLMSLSHVSHACSRLIIFNKNFNDYFLDRFQRDLKFARSKDIERLTLYMNTFNIASDHPLYCNIIEELENRKTEYLRFPRPLPGIILNLMVANLYPPKLINRIMDPKFLNQISGGNLMSLPTQYGMLDCNIRLEMPEYNGELLPDKIRRFLLSRLNKIDVDHDASKISNSNKFILELMYYGSKIMDSSSILHAVKILPHQHRPDIVFGLNEHNNPISLEPILSQIRNTDIKYANSEMLKNIKCMAIVVGHYNLLQKDTCEMTGRLVARIRQIRAAGYTVIPILQHEWLALKTDSEKLEFLKKCIFTNNT